MIARAAGGGVARAGLLKMQSGGIPMGPAFNELVERFRFVQVFVVDEVGACEADHIELASNILDHVMRAVHGLPQNHVFEHGFGNLACIFAGDFAQLPPVLRSRYLLATAEKLTTRGLAGARRFRQFDCIKLKVRYRQKLGSELEQRYGAMTVNLRDSAITKEDYELLQELDFEKKSVEEKKRFMGSDSRVGARPRCGDDGGVRNGGAVS